MLYKLDRLGRVINSANTKKIQPYFKKILKEINKFYFHGLGSNLSSVYVRGSVSVGRAIPFVSDIDSIAIIKNKATDRTLRNIAQFSKKLEKKYPRIAGCDLTVITREELFSRQYSRLRVYLKTQSICLYGQNILNQLPEVKPGRRLAKLMSNDLKEEFVFLRNIFSGREKKPKYNYRRRPIKFWCVWTMRTFLRSGLGLIMVNQPVYTQDLVTCYEMFSQNYPAYQKQMKRALNWSIKPTSNKKTLLNFINIFAPQFLKLWDKI